MYYPEECQPLRKGCSAEQGNTDFSAHFSSLTFFEVCGIVPVFLARSVRKREVAYG